MKKSFITFTCIVVVSFIVNWGLFAHRSQMVTDDYFIHLSSIAQFSGALLDGDFPVRWAGGVANYGSAFPILSHQLTTYLGVGIYMLTRDILFSGSVLFFLGTLFSNLTLYYFLRIYFKNLPSLAAVVLFSFSNYRVYNIYVRGALPEYFSAIFVQLILIGLHQLLVKKHIRSGFLLLTLSVFLLSLNHPMMLVVYSPLIICYLLFILLNQKIKLKNIVLTAVSFILGLGLASYYLIPLIIESKFVYYGRGFGHLDYNQFLNFKNYFTDSWIYPFDRVTFPPYLLRFGIFEIALFIIGTLLIMYFLVRKIKILHTSLFLWFFLSGLIYIFLTLPVSHLLYDRFSILRVIQFPWRMWTGLYMALPVVTAYLLQNFYNKYFLFIFMLLVIFIRIPKLQAAQYEGIRGKSYFINRSNPYTVEMQTIWSGKSESYPEKKSQVGIIDGIGTVRTLVNKNSIRIYDVSSETNLRLIDYTFYFPGWKVYVDKKLEEIQFQDPAYRGLITFNVPEGEHNVKVVFENTKVRLFSNILSVLFILFTFVVGLFIFKEGKKLKN